MASSGVVGEFRSGDGRGPWGTLVIQDALRFNFKWDTDIGSLGSARGTYSIQAYRLLLTFDEVSGRIGPLNGEMIILDWGSVLYLVSDSEVAGFCTAYNRGEEPRSTPGGRYLMRLCGGSQLQPNGVIPPRWAALIRDPRGHGTVTEVLPNGRGFVSLGTHDGLATGHELIVRDPQGTRFCRVMVLGCKEQTARVRNLDGNDSMFQVGWHVRATWLRQ